MKPELKVEFVLVAHWSCWNPDHRHQSEAVAQSCIEKRQSVGKKNRRWTDEAMMDLLQQSRDGATVRELAKCLGLSPARVGELICRAKAKEELGHSSDPFRKLSVRTRNCLVLANLKTVEEVRAALSAGRLNGIPNLGLVSKKEVERWLDDEAGG